MATWIVDTGGDGYAVYTDANPDGASTRVADAFATMDAAIAFRTQHNAKVNRLAIQRRADESAKRMRKINARKLEKRAVLAAAPAADRDPFADDDRDPWEDA